MVILLGLIFLLDRSTQDQIMKIGFIFFRALFYLIYIFKVHANFWSYLNQLEKVLTTRDTCHTPKESGGVSRCGLSGHVACSEGIRRGLSVWAFGTRGMLRRNPKGSLGVAFGTRGTLRRNSEGVSRCGLRDTWHAPKEF